MSEIWLLITAGQGPAECQWVVDRLTGALCAEAKACGLSARLVETMLGEKELPKSALIALSGKGAKAFAQDVEGTVQWIGESPFRPKHKRKNWFAGVFALPPPEDAPHLDAKEVTFQTMRASGPGGQHVNTTDSAVRATHTPSGLTVVAREERSQHANKRLAMVKLAAALGRRSEGQAANQEQERWQQHYEVERGNPVRVYEGTRFRRRKGR